MGENWQQESEERRARLVEFIGTLSLNYRADFVPMSQSRNKVDNPRKPSDLTINWRITLLRGRAKLVTDYQQGIGYLPKVAKYDLGYKDDFDCAKIACERNEFYRKGTHLLTKVKFDSPELVDVLYSLVSDAEAIECASFEDWAQEFGYDADSRNAEAMYRACLSIGLQLRQLIGDDNLCQLRELYQDY